MKKKEAFEHIRQHKGFVPYVDLFDLYDDEEEIPQFLIDISLKEDKPNGCFFIGNRDSVEITKKQIIHPWENEEEYVKYGNIFLDIRLKKE